MPAGLTVPDSNSGLSEKCTALKGMADSSGALSSAWHLVQLRSKVDPSCKV